MEDKKIENKKWKDKFLSSSFPLEYFAGKVLAEKGFSLTFDYSYSRYDINKGEYVDFSVDLHGLGFYPFGKDEIKAEIDLLVECKYRNPNVKWVFIPDLNIEEFEEFTSAGVIKYVDNFTQFSIKKAYTEEFENLKTCLKGTEIDFGNANVNDSQLIHAISQIQYALPSVLKKNIFSNLSSPKSETRPFIICPIILTTAELLVVDKDINFERFLEIDDINEISKKVDYLTFHTGTSPDFHTHCRKIFRENLYPDQDKKIIELEQLRQVSTEMLIKGNFHSTPEMLYKSLLLGFESDFFREMIICNINSFDKLIDEIKQNINLSLQNMIELK